MVLSLEEISDRFEIQDLLVAYCHAIDTRNWDALDDVFTADAVIDYTEMGGAPLLGMNGAAIICHGASPVKAIKNAVRVAAEWVRNDVNQHIKTALEAEAVLAEGREGGRE